MIWNNSKMACLYYSKDLADEQWHCVVRITEDEIFLEYDNDGVVQYIGKNTGSGHFELRSSQVNGRATLHQSPSSQILEGSWVEDGQRGMWRIELA